MKTKTNNKHTTTQIVNLVSNSDANELTALISELHEGKTPDWREKLALIFDSIEDNIYLESLASALTAPQIRELIAYFGHAPSKLSKLLPLLVGLQSPVFLDLLLQSNAEDLAPLMSLESTEPLQHHLALLREHLKHEQELLSKKYESIWNAIDGLNPKQINESDLHSINQEILVLSKDSQSFVKFVRKLLFPLWKGGLSTLISEMSEIKERTMWIHQNTIDSGEVKLSSGNLPAFLHYKMFLIYIGDNGNFPKEDESAIESITKLGLWYPRDYWRIGLLPDISNPDQHSPNELTIKAKRHLEKIGLATLKDLKKRGIYSSNTLENYIKTHLT